MRVLVHDETCTMVRDGAGRASTRENKTWTCMERKKKKKSACYDRRTRATACMQINAFLYLPNSQYTRLHPTYLATGGTVKSENVQYGIATADNLLRAFLYFCIFVSLYLWLIKVLEWRYVIWMFKILFAFCILHLLYCYYHLLLLLLVSISFKLNSLQCYKSILIFYNVLKIMCLYF